MGGLVYGETSKKIATSFQNGIGIDDVYIKIPDFRLSIYFGVAIVID